MLFDENKNIDSSNRLFIKYNSEEMDSLVPYLEDSIRNMNEIFYNESKEIIIKEAFAKTIGSNSLLNESVDDFLKKFENSINNITNVLDKTFEKFAKTLASRFMKDKKFIDTYREEFMSLENKKIKMTVYTIDDSIPNFIILNDLVNSFNIDIRKIDISSVKQYIKKESYFDIKRGEILGKPNTRIKEANFKEACFKVFRNGTGKQEIIDLTPELQVKMLQAVTSMESDLRTLEADKNKIKGFINMSIKNILNQYQFISKYEGLTLYEYDLYTSYIYNQINELRKICKQFEIAFGVKMDAVKSREIEYMNVIRSLIKSTISEEQELIPILQLEDYQLTEAEVIEESFFNLEMDNICKDMMVILYNEDLQLLSEGPKELIMSIIDRIKEGLQAILNKFISTKPKNFDKKYPKEVTVIELLNKEEYSKFKLSALEYNVNNMKKCLKFKPVRQINNIEQEMADINKFRQKYFPSLYNGYNGQSDADWGKHVMNKFRGKKLDNPKVIVKNAFIYCSSNYYEANKKELANSCQVLIKTCDEIKQEINRELSNTNTTTDNKAIQNNSADLIISEEIKDAKAELDKENKKNQETNSANAKEMAQKNQENFNKADYSDVTKNKKGDSPKIKAMRKYVLELSKIQGYAYKAFNEGYESYSAYLTKLLAYGKASKVVGDKKEDVKEKGVKQTVKDNVVKTKTSIIDKFKKKK